MISELDEYGVNVQVYDPWVDKAEAQKEYGITPIGSLENGQYDAIILAVSHDEFIKMEADVIHKLCKDNHVLFDIKYLLKADEVDGRL